MTSPQDLINRPGDNLSVTPEERATRDGQTGLVVWFTGLSGAGKTTLAVSVERRLFDLGYRTFLIDGDLLRAGLCSDLGYGAADRHENVRRAGVVSSLMANAGLICLTALISPFRADRARARNLLPRAAFWRCMSMHRYLFARHGTSKDFIDAREPMRFQILPGSLPSTNRPIRLISKCALIS